MPRMPQQPLAAAFYTLALAALTTSACSKDAGTAPRAESSAPASFASSPTALPSSSPAASVSVATSPAGASAERGPNAPLTLDRDGQRASATRAKSVLHFGDSMVPLVANYLRPLIEKSGGRYEIVSTSSSTTLSWAEGDKLTELLSKHDPELVLISLGSNELFFEDDLEQRGKAVRNIVERVGARPCLWIGPPAWTKLRGFLEILAKNLDRCGYFDSAVLNMDRQADGRHPTWGASHAWAGKVWERLGGEAAEFQ
jgi:hypothetical protein